MKIQLIVLLFAISILFSCKEEEPHPINFIKVNIDETTYTFLGRSIIEPVDAVKDTLYNMTYLGGYIGNCLDGATQFVDIRINHISTGEYDIKSGVSFWMHTDTPHGMDLDDPETETFNLTISEYGDADGRITGTFTGIHQNINGSSLPFSGEFSLKRLPNHSATFEVAKELCPEFYDEN